MKPTEREIYASQHSCCPRCLHSEISSTCVGQVYFPGTTWSQMRDSNRASCTKCDWVGIVHDLIPAANWDNSFDIEQFKDFTRSMYMTELERKALATAPLKAAIVDGIYVCAPLMTREKAIEELQRVCVSHERLRAELAGAEILIAESPPKETTKKAIDALTVMEKALRELQLCSPNHEVIWRDDSGLTVCITLSEWVEYVLDKARGPKPPSFTESTEAFLFGKPENGNKD